MPVSENNHCRKRRNCTDRPAQEDKDARIAPRLQDSLHASSVRGAHSDPHDFGPCSELELEQSRRGLFRITSGTALTGGEPPGLHTYPHFCTRALAIASRWGTPARLPLPAAACSRPASTHKS